MTYLKYVICVFKAETNFPLPNKSIVEWAGHRDREILDIEFENLTEEARKMPERHNSSRQLLLYGDRRRLPF